MLMLNVYILHLISVILLVYIYKKNGLAAVLPIYIFLMIFIPENAQFQIFELFDLTIQRTTTITIILLSVFSSNKATNNRIQLKYLILIVIITSVISNAYSVVPSISFKRMLAYTFEFYVLYFVLCKYINDIHTITKILISIHLAITLTCLIGIIENINGWSLSQLFPSELGRFSFLNRSTLARVGRIKSVFPHPILFGGAIALTLPITFHLLNISKTKISKIILWISLLLMLFCLWKTTSRGPWIAAAIAILLLFIFYPATRKFILIIAVLGILVLIARPGIWLSLQNIARATFDPSTPLGSSYSYRYVLLNVVQEALSSDAMRFILGYGQDSFFHLGLEAELNERIHRFLSCDSSWIKILIESGYLGLFLSMLIFRKSLVNSVKNSFNLSYRYRNNFIIYMIGMIVFYFMMTNVAIYGWGQNGYILWIMIALTFTNEELMYRPQNLYINIEEKATNS
jgi:hypothetical protein